MPGWPSAWPRAVGGQFALGFVLGIAWAPCTGPVLGGAVALFGLLVLTGLDKALEAWATARLPDAWLDLIVRF